MAQSIQVQILGQAFAVSSDDDEAWVKRIAAIVDEQIRTIVASGRAVPPFSAAVIAALNLASEYHKLKNQFEHVQEVIDRLAIRLTLPEEGAVDVGEDVGSASGARAGRVVEDSRD